MRTRLDKLNGGKNADCGKPKVLQTILPKQVEDKKQNLSPGPSYTDLRSRSLSAPDQPHVTENKVLRTVTMTEQQKYMVSKTTPNISGTQPPLRCPPVTSSPATQMFGIPRLPLPGYNPLYHAYAATARAYYDNMYMMNYKLMTQNAMLHPRNLATQNGGYPGLQLNQGNNTQKKQDSDNQMTYNNLDSVIEQSVTMTDNNNQTFCRRLSLDSSRNPHENDVKQNSEESLESFKERREEAAIELLKMSKTGSEPGGDGTSRASDPEGIHDTVRSRPKRLHDRRPCNELQLTMAQPKDSYVVDYGKSVDFTKCISDVIDKTMKSNKQKIASVSTAGMSDKGNQSSGQQPDVKCQQQEVKVPQSEVKGEQSEIKGWYHEVIEGESGSTRQLYGSSRTPATTRTHQSCSGSIWHTRPCEEQTRVLNLSQKKVNTDSTFQKQTEYSLPDVKSFLGNHANVAVISSNYPKYPQSFFGSPVQRFPQNFASYYPNLIPTYCMPEPLNMFGHQAYNMPMHRNLSPGKHHESPKKRHASYHDVNRPGVALDFRTKDTNYRSRHMSENFGSMVLRQPATGDEQETTMSQEVMSAVVDPVNNLDKPKDMSESAKEMSVITECNYDKSKSLKMNMGQVESESGNGEAKLEQETDNKSDVSVGKDKTLAENVTEGDKQELRNCFDESLEEKKLEIDFDYMKESDDRMLHVDKNEVETEKDKKGVEVNDSKMSGRECVTEKEDDHGKIAETGTSNLIDKIIAGETATVVYTDIDSVVGAASDIHSKNAEISIDGSRNREEPKQDDGTSSCFGSSLFSPVDQTLETETEQNNCIENHAGPEFGKANHRSDAEMTCGLCWQKFSTVEEVEKHQIVHARELNIGNTCKHCDRAFPRPFDLQCHILKMHSDTGLFSQNKEENEQKNVAKSSSAVKVDTENDVFECEFCGSKMTTLEEFRNHLRTHGGAKPYICNVCLRTFAHKHNLNRHKMSHNSKSFECSICQRTFKETFYLQMHMKIHSEENTRRCEICDKQIPRSELWKHTSEHLRNIVDNPTYDQIGRRVQEILKEQNSNTSAESDTKVELLTDQFEKMKQARGSLDQLTKQIMQLAKSRKMNRNENIENINIPVRSKDNNDPNGHKNVLTAKNGGKGNHMKELVSGRGNDNVSDLGSKVVSPMKVRSPGKVRSPDRRRILKFY